MKSPGIHARLLVTGFLVISLTAFTLGTIGVKMFHDFAQNRFAERFEFLARYLALNSELGILIDQRSMLNQLANNLLAEEDVARVLIFNNADETLAEASKLIPRPYATVEAPVRLKASSEESQAFLWVFPSPLTGEPLDIIGKVRIIYSTSQINRLLKTITVRYLWFTAGLAALCLVIFFFISRSLVFPLTRLAQTARKVGAGELQLRMMPGNIPETREVSLAFNAMLDSLERGRKAVEKANQEMARQNLLAEMGKFSMMIAHEIKNPLGIIKSSFDLLKKDPADPSNSILIGYIEEEIQRINSLIEDFLSFAKPAKPSFRVVDANGMLRDCIDRFCRMDTAGDIEFKGHIPEISCLSYLDPDLFRRAIDNILKNAVEACRGFGVIFVDAVCMEDTWRVDIADDGCGIQENMVSKIFNPFVTTRAKGTGLGLAYTAQVISAHSGTISVENRNPTGARFKIEIPREPKMIDLFDADGVKE
ncbi:MAG: HAMP domain-containing histidine kinase [Desulfobacteraceae bacterium]|nr:HAMP domain-containing histidine kinase [Desulfobacteraceae bacterium]MBC2754918.1 HAMP domain-containing histidine kinase [Desulfobacteraceae bacterium]